MCPSIRGVGEAGEECARGRVGKEVREVPGAGVELITEALTASVRTLAFTLNEVGSHRDLLGTMREMYKLYVRYYLINTQIQEHDNS